MEGSFRYCGPGAVSEMSDRLERDVTDRKRLIDVSAEKVVVTIFASRALLLRSLGRQLRHALNSLDVVLLLSGREGRPLLADNNVEGVALLPLTSLRSGLVNLLVHSSDTGIDIGLQHTPRSHLGPSVK